MSADAKSRFDDSTAAQQRFLSLFPRSEREIMKRVSPLNSGPAAELTSQHSMNTKLSLLALVSILTGQLGRAQTNQPAAEDFKPSSLNQPGKQYPQVNSERRVRARVVAPQAQSVMLDLGGGK